MRSGLALLLLTGCETFFPLNVDATEVSGKLAVTRIENDASGLPRVIADAPPPAGVTIVAHVDDKVIDVDIESSGAFAFERFGRDYRLVVTTELGFPIEVQSNAETITIPLLLAGRDGVGLPTDPTIVTVPDQGTARHLVSTGQWSDNVLLSGDTTFDWKLAKPTGGRPIGLLDSTQHDRLFLLEYATANGASTVVQASEFTGVMMANALPLTMPPPTPTTPNGCIRFAPTLDESQTRLAQAFGDYTIDPDLDYTGAVGGLNVLATPSTALGTTAITTIASVTNTDLDSMTDLAFHDPLPRHQHVAMATAIAGRSVTRPGAVSPGPAFSGLLVLQDIADDDATCDGADLVTFDRPLAFAIGPTLAGKALDHDDVEIGIARPGTIALTWDIDGGGIVDSYEVVIAEVAIGSGGIAVLIPVRQYLVTERQITIDDETLEPNKYYVAQIASSFGRHEAVMGDFATNDYPIGSGVVLTTTFFVPR